MSRISNRTVTTVEWARAGQSLIPGLAAVIAIAAASWWLGAIVPVVGSAVFALLIGIALGNVIRPPAALRPGVDFTLKRLLRVAIVLFGAGLSFVEVVTLGGGSLLIIFTTIVLALVLTALFGRWLRAPSRLVNLIGVGTAICGATAIVTVGPIIEATEDETAFAVTTIFLFNMLALLIYPFLGHLLGTSDRVFGVWAGTAIHDTSSVLAASYTFSDAAGGVATVVKLTRTLMLVPLALLIGLLQSMRAGRASEPARSSLRFARIFPWFILWFVVAALLNTFGLLPPPAIRAGTAAGKFMIVMVMGAVGLGADLRRMAGIGVRPFLIGLFSSVLIAAVSLILIRALLTTPG